MVLSVNDTLKLCFIVNFGKCLILQETCNLRLQNCFGFQFNSLSETHGEKPEGSVVAQVVGAATEPFRATCVSGKELRELESDSCKSGHTY
jgi:hypothetical protein